MYELAGHITGRVASRCPGSVPVAKTFEDPRIRAHHEQFGLHWKRVLEENVGRVCWKRLVKETAGRQH